MKTLPRKTPMIRKGQKHPYVKPTNAEIEMRVERVGRWMTADQLTKSEIHKKAKSEWSVSWRTADRYMASARAFALKRAGKSKQDVFAEAVMFNEGIIRNPKAPWSMKINARRELNQLFAIYPPKIVHQRVGGDGQEPIKVENYRPLKGISEARLRELANLIPTNLSRQNGNGDGH